jgi:competence ComEA-like helix-hairpin-helix protein
MRRIKVLIRFLFGFSQTETNAFLVLLPLMLIVVAGEPVYQTYFMSNYPDDVKDRQMLDSIVAHWELPKENNTTVVKKAPFKKKVIARPRPKFQKEKFDINLADTTQLKSIYGIGTVISKRIITYRTSLGGFISPDQLYEVWGLDSTVVGRLAERMVIAPGFTPNKLAINRCSEQDLARHPYLRTKLARAIVTYRFQHGNFASVDDLKKIGTMEEKIFLRIKPYITLD